jgi:hypothetical protein
MIGETAQFPNRERLVWVVEEQSEEIIRSFVPKQIRIRCRDWKLDSRGLIRPRVPVIWTILFSHS